MYNVMFQLHQKTLLLHIYSLTSGTYPCNALKLKNTLWHSNTARVKPLQTNITVAIGLTSGPRHTQYMSKQTDFITLRLLLNDFLDISSLSKQSKRCGHIWFCTTCWVNGSMPQHKSYAIDMAKRPQSAPPTCGVTPITLMVILEHVLFSDLVI